MSEPNYPPRYDPTLAVGHTLDRLEGLLFDPHGDDTGYDLHPLPLFEFLRNIALCGPPGTFLDLGCGVGTKLAVAHYLGWVTTGLERHADYAATARRLMPEATVLTGDAWAFGGLADFDVVYSYRLMFDMAEQQRLNAHIAARMRAGALYVCAGSEPDGLGLQPVGESVWRV